MISDLKLFAILSVLASASTALLMAMFFGASPFYAYSLITDFEWYNPSDIALIVILYSPALLLPLYFFGKLLGGKR